MAKDPVLVVLQLSGGNDYMNTVIPYANSLYWDNRPAVNIPEDKIIALDDKVGTAAWHTKPSWYLVANQDRMIDPRAEEAMARQIGATTTHVNSSHVPMLSQPKAVADAIIAAASKVH